jgi:bifunctional non-homologous end joining protein LigD
LVAKKLDSTYQPGKRSASWIRHPLIHTQEVVIGGWHPGENGVTGTVGSLLLGAHDEHGQLQYIRDVGSGFTDRMRDDLLRLLEPLQRPTSPVANAVPRDRARSARWVEPRIVGEVAYRTFTRDMRLRHVAWRGLRIGDKRPAGDLVTWAVTEDSIQTLPMCQCRLYCFGHAEV